MKLGVLWRLSRLVKPLAKYMCIAVTLGTLAALCALLVPVSGAFALVYAMQGKPLAFIFTVLIVSAIARGLLRYGEQWCNHYIAFRLLALIRDKVFGALRRLSPAKLEGKEQGNLVSLITADIELLEVFYAHTISPILIALLFTIVMVCFFAHYNALLALLAFASYCAVGIAVPLLTSAHEGNLGSEAREASGALSTDVLESLRGVDEVIQYGAGERRIAHMNEIAEELVLTQEELTHHSSLSTALTMGLVLLLDAAMIMAGVMLQGNGELTFYDVLLTSVAFMSSFGPVSALAALGSTLQNTIAAGERVLAILDEEPLTQDIADQPAFAFDGMDAENISFGYDPDEKVLDDVSLNVKKNEILGIQGRSGSGKSTLLKLMMRFFDVDSGEISFSGRNINAVNTKDLRDVESYMTQTTHLFTGTLKSNLLIAKEDASDEEIEEACRKASIHDWIMSLENGYETEVGELGETLSGGERQRIGLARAFLHDSDLILLDEPSSNLDSLNEAVILKSLKKEREGKTIVLVSHRDSTMRIADRIYQMEEGRVV